MNVLICDSVHPLLLDGLKARHFWFEYRPDISPEAALALVHDFDILVVNTKTIVDAAFLQKAARLKLIIRLGSGMDTIDVPLAQSMGILAVNTPDGNANAVGEHTLSLLLSLMNCICPANSSVKTGLWEREEHRGNELDGKTVGIIGFGHTGPAFAKKLRGFDVEILVFDKYRQHFGKDFRYVQEAGLDDLLEHADVISLHIPLTIETLGYADHHFFRKCRRQIYFINTSRGKVVRTEDLIQNVESGKILGAGIDVLENEKPGTYNEAEKRMYQKLYDFPNVLMTPHIAGWTFESKEKIARQVLSLILGFLK